ncbi:Uncharacterised protein [Prevotella nigrescens]|nr:Uncharacterised protein [Prevotella nigrescens]
MLLQQRNSIYHLSFLYLMACSGFLEHVNNSLCVIGIDHLRFKATDGRTKFLAHDFRHIECCQ